jgi:transcription initiation factor TFIID subunit 7
MLVVDHPVPNEAAIPPASTNPDEYIWPHGLTPPLRHVRKRRFRKRMSRRTIEVVEEQVEELFKRDDEADEMTFGVPSLLQSSSRLMLMDADMIDAHPDPDIPDSYYIDYDPNAEWHHTEHEGSEFGGLEMYDDPGSALPPGTEDWGEEGGEYGGEMGEDGGEGEEGEDEDEEEEGDEFDECV